MGQVLADTGKMRGWLAGTLLALASVVVLVAVMAMGQALVSAMDSSSPSMSEADPLAPDTSAMQMP